MEQGREAHEDLGAGVTPLPAFVREQAPAGGVAKTPNPSSPSLQSALRRARADNAERSDVVAELRTAEFARLDILREHLAPVLDQVPKNCDMFDLGLAPGEHPRLFIDMIAFVEMTRDRRGYRLVQDTRHGRVTLAETDNIGAAVRAVADYIARRLVERERALAADALYGANAAPPAATQTAQTQVSHARPLGRVAADASGPEEAASRAIRSVGAAAAPRARPEGLRVFSRAFVFLIEALGSAAFFGLLAAAGYWLWLRYGH